jgi:hypothetical protein
VAIALVRTSHAHARIRAIDVAASGALPGVVRVGDGNLVAVREVSFVGDIVAAVVAVDRDPTAADVPPLAPLGWKTVDRLSITPELVRAMVGEMPLLTTVAGEPTSGEGGRRWPWQSVASGSAGASTSPPRDGS